MAVHQNRRTRSCRGMRRSHDGLSSITLATEVTTGEKHLRHHISPDGYYKGDYIFASHKQDDLSISDKD